MFGDISRLLDQVNSLPGVAPERMLVLANGCQRRFKKTTCESDSDVHVGCAMDGATKNKMHHALR